MTHRLATIDIRCYRRQTATDRRTQ